MTRSAMIQRVSKVIKNGGKCVIITGTVCTEDIVQVERINSQELGDILACRYFDEGEESNPFNEGEFAWFPTWYGAGNIVDSICATATKAK